MERFKAIFKKLLRPHRLIAVLVTLLAFPALIWIFLMGYDTRWFAYPIFVFAFYALTADCCVLLPWLIRLVKKKKTAEKNLDEKALAGRLKRKLYQGLAINLTYGIIQIIQGILIGSAWIGGNGLYNTVHGLARTVLLRYERKLEAIENRQERSRLAWKCYRLCGVAMFAVNLTMTGLTFQMIWWNRTKVHSEIMTIAVAAFTFYKLTAAIIGVFRCRKNNSPILGAAKNMNMAESLMSLFTLQTALFAVFGQDFEAQFIMNSLTGLAVCLSTVLGGVGMIFHANKKLKEIGGHDTNGE